MNGGRVYKNNVAEQGDEKESSQQSGFVRSRLIVCTTIPTDSMI